MFWNCYLLFCHVEVLMLILYQSLTGTWIEILTFCLLWYACSGLACYSNVLKSDRVSNGSQQISLMTGTLWATSSWCQGVFISLWMVGYNGHCMQCLFFLIASHYHCFSWPTLLFLYTVKKALSLVWIDSGIVTYWWSMRCVPPAQGWATADFEMF